MILLGQKTFIDLKGRVGSTDYIDFAIPNEIEYPVMKGVDAYRRSFISLIYTGWVVTFFQRYTPERKYWTYGGKTFNGLGSIGGK